MGHFFGYGAILQVIALVHYARRRPDGYWIWIIFFGGGIGAAAYLLAEALPTFGTMRHSMQGFSRRKQIRMLQVMVLENPSAGNFEELGDLLLDEGKYLQAKECFDRALGSRTDSIDPFYKRGVCEFELGEWAAAVSDLERVVKLDPKYAYSRAQSLQARALTKLGRTAEAETAFGRLLELSTSSESLAVAAEFYLEQGRAEEARDIARRLLARKVTMPAFQRRRDRVWLRQASKVIRASAQKSSTAAARPARETATEESNTPPGRALGR
jgi:hypothetical protein